MSDVEEGGETYFNQLDLAVSPKKGRALIWPSVTDDDPKFWDARMFHEAKDVIRGKKLAANHCECFRPGLDRRRFILRSTVKFYHRVTSSARLLTDRSAGSWPAPPSGSLQGSISTITGRPINGVVPEVSLNSFCCSSSCSGGKYLRPVRLCSNIVSKLGFSHGAFSYQEL